MSALKGWLRREEVETWGHVLFSVTPPRKGIWMKAQTHDTPGFQPTDQDFMPQTRFFFFFLEAISLENPRFVGLQGQRCAQCIQAAPKCSEHLAPGGD